MYQTLPFRNIRFRKAVSLRVCALVCHDAFTYAIIHFL